MSWVERRVFGEKTMHNMHKEDAGVWVGIWPRWIQKLVQGFRL